VPPKCPPLPSEKFLCTQALSLRESAELDGIYSLTILYVVRDMLAKILELVESNDCSPKAKLDHLLLQQGHPSPRYWNRIPLGKVTRRGGITLEHTVQQANSCAQKTSLDLVYLLYEKECRDSSSNAHDDHAVDNSIPDFEMPTYRNQPPCKRDE
jgi:hypothetical protein